jgi:ABC-type lipoprotein release transport system permease subunit
VSPTDPVALGGAVVLLAAVALAASAVPVRRALRIDPTDTLRAE